MAGEFQAAETMSKKSQPKEPRIRADRASGGADNRASFAHSLASLLGPRGPHVVSAMHQGKAFLNGQSQAQLLAALGQTVAAIAPFEAITKTALQDSYGGNQAGPPDDFLVGQGLFYISEQRRLYLDCTAGHYQMVWGYHPPHLCALVEEAQQAGVIWDNHSNIPQAPVKQLAHRLVEVANAPGEKDPLDTVLLGVCTGSVACAAALKIQLKVFAREHGTETKPILVVLEGNYHGTDMVPQFMRGLWPHWLPQLEVISLEPNDSEALEAAFKQQGDRIAAFWAEPVMMNREALAVDRAYLHLAQRCCRATGALFCIDEIQTGFWQPQVFEFRALGLQPDLVVVGKGMTAGFHPLSAVLMKQRYDLLEQYDAISTNGSAALPALLGLCNLALISDQTARIEQIGQRIFGGFASLANEFPDRIQSAQGRGYLAGIKFREAQDAIGFHRKALEAGLWTRVHAYHPGHRTLLTKLGLLADEHTVDFIMERLRSLLKNG